MDFNEKLREREDYYNYGRPHGGLNGQTPKDRSRSVTAVLGTYTDAKQPVTSTGCFFARKLVRILGGDWLDHSCS